MFREVLEPEAETWRTSVGASKRLRENVETAWASAESWDAEGGVLGRHVEVYCSARGPKPCVL